MQQVGQIFLGEMTAKTSVKNGTATSVGSEDEFSIALDGVIEKTAVDSENSAADLAIAEKTTLEQNSDQKINSSVPSLDANEDVTESEHILSANGTAGLLFSQIEFSSNFNAESGEYSDVSQGSRFNKQLQLLKFAENSQLDIVKLTDVNQKLGSATGVAELDALSMSTGETDLELLSGLTGMDIKQLAQLSDTDIEQLIAKIGMSPKTLQALYMQDGSVAELVDIKGNESVKEQNNPILNADAVGNNKILMANIMAQDGKILPPEDKFQTQPLASIIQTYMSADDISAENNTLETELDGKLMTAMMSKDNEIKTEKVLFSEAIVKLKNANITLNMLASSTESSSTLDNEMSNLQLGQSINSQLQHARSEIPQFQLSLRQAADSQIQQYELMQRFAPVMKQQLVNMVSQGIHQAEIRLDPPELGQLMVRLQVQGDQTQVHFHVAQQQTRELIEQALPKLKEMLQEQGMQLADSQVSEDKGQQHQGNGEQQSEAVFFQTGTSDDATQGTVAQGYLATDGSGIDYYA